MALVSRAIGALFRRPALPARGLSHCRTGQPHSPSVRHFASLSRPPVRVTRIPTPHAYFVHTSSLLPHPSTLAGESAWAAARVSTPLRGRRVLHVGSGDWKGSERTPADEQRVGHERVPAGVHSRNDADEERAAVHIHNDALRHLHGLGGCPIDVARACDLLQKAADAGYASAMVLLAQHYLMGVGVPFDALEGVRLLRAAAEGGCLDAQVELARVLIVASRTRDDPFLARRCERLTGSERNPMYGAMKAAKDIGGDAREGVRLLEEAAAAGNDIALAYLGTLRLRAADEQELPPLDVLPRDDNLGVSLHRKAVEAGNTAAVHTLASALLADAKTEAEGEELLRQSAAKGDLRSQALLADHLLRSEDPALEAEGRAMAHKAAEAGDVKAMYYYACALCGGLGGAEDGPEGGKWLLRAGEGGIADAQKLLGMLHMNLKENDLGFSWNAEKARYWLTLAAWGGSVESQRMLASHCLGFLGGGSDMEEALFWMEKSAQSNTRSQFEAGFMYLRGLGAPKDPEKGWAYVRRAAEGGDVQAVWSLGLALMSGRAAPWIERDVAEGERLLESAVAVGSPDAKAALAQCYLHGDDPELRKRGEAMLSEVLGAHPFVLDHMLLLTDEPWSPRRRAAAT